MASPAGPPLERLIDVYVMEIASSITKHRIRIGLRAFKARRFVTLKAKLIAVGLECRIKPAGGFIR